MQARRNKLFADSTRAHNWSQTLVLDFAGSTTCENGFITGYKKEIDFENTKLIRAEVKEIIKHKDQSSLKKEDIALVLSDPILVKMLKIGDKLKFNLNETGIVNKITIDTNTVWFQGNTLFLSNIKFENSVDILFSPQIFKEYNASLFQRAFSTSDLQRMPFAWGKSVKTLEKRMALVQSLDEITPQISELLAENKQYSINGIDPNLIFYFNKNEISGKSAGLLKFDFNCIQKNKDPKLQIFWWGDDRSGPFEASSVIFSGDTGIFNRPT